MVIALFERKRSSASRLYGGNRFLASDSCSRKNRRSRVSWSLSRASKSERAFRGKASRFSNERTFQASGFYGDFS